MRGEREQRERVALEERRGEERERRESRERRGEPEPSS
jgi:hypothetical protein